MNWWERGEWSDTRGDYQAPPDFNNSAGADLLGDASATAEMFDTPLGEPPSQFDVRSTYESRPVNAYDFNYSEAVPVSFAFNANSTAETVLWASSFMAPNGYRAVPKEWDMWLEPEAGFFGIAPSSASKASITQAGAAIPNNQDIIIGLGTDRPIKTFFVCEENTAFGASGEITYNPQLAITEHVNMNVHVWGTLIPVSEVSLPYAIANQRKLKDET